MKPKKLDPEVFRLAATYLAADPTAGEGAVGCCAAIERACRGMGDYAVTYISALYDVYRPEWAGPYWWHSGDPVYPTKKNQEERFIALCLLAEMCDE